MLEFIVKKILMIIPMLLVISILIFIGMHATGIDPVYYMAPPDMLSSTENLDILREQLGLNDPVYVQYFNWLKNITRGDFGYSMVTGVPIGTTIRNRLPATIELSGISLLLATIIGVSIGLISAIKQNGIIDYIGRIFAVTGQAIPQFVFGMLMLLIFSIKLGWFPSVGRISPTFTSLFWDRVWHLVLPVVALTISLCAILMRYARNTMLDVMNSDYIKTARSKGIPEWKVFIKHGFRNAMRPVMVILMFRIPMLVGGAVVVENVFSWPGIGSALTDSITSNDYPVVLVLTLMIALVMLISSFLIDVFNALLDPRIRLGNKS